MKSMTYRSLEASSCEILPKTTLERSQAVDFKGFIYAAKPREMYMKFMPKLLTNEFNSVFLYN
jgi:hypothetical protein